VLEKVCKTRFSRFDFIPGSRANNGVIGDNLGIIERNGNDLQSVFKFFYFILVGKDIGTGKERRNDGEKKDNGKDGG